MDSPNIVDSVAIEAYIQQNLGPDSVYTTLVDKARDMSHPCYRMAGPEGENFRACVSNKIMRTIQSGKSFQTNPTDTPVFAVAKMTKDGQVQSEAVDMSNKNGLNNARENADGPRFEHVNGVSRVTVNTEKIKR